VDVENMHLLAVNKMQMAGLLWPICIHCRSR